MERHAPCTAIAADAALDAQRRPCRQRAPGRGAGRRAGRRRRTRHGPCSRARPGAGWRRARCRVPRAPFGARLRARAGRRRRRWRSAAAARPRWRRACCANAAARAVQILDPRIDPRALGPGDRARARRPARRQRDHAARQPASGRRCVAGAGARAVRCVRASCRSRARRCCSAAPAAHARFDRTRVRGAGGAAGSACCAREGGSLLVTDVAAHAARHCAQRLRAALRRNARAWSGSATQDGAESLCRPAGLGRPHRLHRRIRSTCCREACATRVPVFVSTRSARAAGCACSSTALLARGRIRALDDDAGAVRGRAAARDRARRRAKCAQRLGSASR